MGLSLDTRRAWERRYKAVVPERSNRGRMYGRAEIDRLVVLAKLVQKGHAIGGIASLDSQQLQDLLTQQQSQMPAEASTVDLLEPILSAIGKFDAATARDEINRFAAFLSPRDFVYQAVVPLMREIGIRWHDGTVSIAQEHMLTQLLRDVLGSMLRIYQSSGRSKKFIFATPVGETHEFGLLAAAMLTSMRGIEAIYLGSNLPAQDIADAAKITSASVVVLGVALPSMNTSSEISSLAEAMPLDAELWIGGAGGSALDLSDVSRRLVLLHDLGAFETECQRLGS